MGRSEWQNSKGVVRVDERLGIGSEGGSREGMAVDVETRDCIAIADADLDEMAAMGAAFGIGQFSKAKESWVLCTRARIDGKLHGVMFATLERIGGTPCVLVGLLSVKRTGKRDSVLKGLMAEAFHRALMAFPDEDVVVGTRFVAADGFDAFKQLTSIIPRPGHRAVGEERAWGKRLAKRFGVDAGYDDQTFTVKNNGQGAFLDYQSLKPEKIAPDVAALFGSVKADKGGALIAYGWTMAEDLLKIGKR